MIPVLLSGLTRSNMLIGLGASLNDTGWLLPQIFVAPWASRHAQQLWIYRRAAVVRARRISVLLAALAWRAARPSRCLARSMFFGCYGIYSFGAGFGAVAFMEVCGRVVPGAARLVLLAAHVLGRAERRVRVLAVREILDIDSTAAKLLILFGLSSVIVSIAYAAFGAIRGAAEPGDPDGADTARCCAKA